MAKPSVEMLRGVFREEFADLLHVLGRQADRAERASSPDDVAGAGAEVRRAVHTLKGAAHAVGYPALEAECHRLETSIEKLRASGLLTAAEVLTTARAAITMMNRYSALVHASPDAPTSSGPPSIVGAADASDSSLPPAGAATAAAGAAGAAEPMNETVRVDANALAAILVTSENLVLEMSRGVERTSRVTVESATVDLLRELDHLRRLAAAYETTSGSHAASELRRRLDRAFGTARTLGAASDALASREAVAWTDASARAKAVAGAARGMRQDRFEGLATAALQAAQDAATDAGVELRVERSGDDVKFDRRLREPLREILLHLARNSVAHGIESPEERKAQGKPAAGLLTISAEEGEGELRIIVSDDGRGIDLDAVATRARAMGIDAPPLEALFAPGLSTRRDADQLAGRGVGLDVVLQRVTELHGRIVAETEPGRGTTFRLVVAPDMSLTRALLARAGSFSVALRLSAVERVIRTPRAEVRIASGRAHVLHEGSLLPLASVSGELGATEMELPPSGTFTSVIAGAGERRVALVVDELLDEREIAVRPLQGRFRSIPFVSGTTILENGTVGWVLDVRALATVARGVVPTEGTERSAVRRVLVVDDSATTRELERALLRAAGFEVEAVGDGEQAWLALNGEKHFDVVLTDVEMPRLDGFSLLGRIRSSPRLAQLPVVLVTALADPSDKQRALDMGASAYIVKSDFDENRLLDVIADLL